MTKRVAAATQMFAKHEAEQASKGPRPEQLSVTDVAFSGQLIGRSQTGDVTARGGAERQPGSR